MELTKAETLTFIQNDKAQTDVETILQPNKKVNQTSKFLQFLISVVSICIIYTDKFIFYDLKPNTILAHVQ